MEFKTLTHANDYINLLEVENSIIQNELQDALLPSLSISKITFLVAELIQTNIDFVKKNGITAAANKQRITLLKLMNITETFNTLSCQNNTLQLVNRSLSKELYHLKLQLVEIKRQENLGKSL